MSTTTSDIAAGAVVRWISSNIYKQGVVEAVVPAGRTPADVGFPKAGGGGLARDHKSYIVRGRKFAGGKEYGSKALYWPHVSLLELRTPADVVAPVSNGWQPIETAPKDGTPILAYGPLPGCNADEHSWHGVRETKWKCYPLGSPGYVAWERGEGPLGIGWDWYESVHNWSHVWKPTHWMPLPSAPSQIEEGKDNG